MKGKNMKEIKDKLKEKEDKIGLGFMMYYLY